jgi:hypothetical protein
MNLDDHAAQLTFLIQNRDSKFTDTFDAVFASEGLRTLRTPVRAPRANAIAERWIGTIRRELLDRILTLHRRHLDHTLAEYLTHVNHHHPPHYTKQHPSNPSPTPHHRPTFASNTTTGSADSSTNMLRPHNGDDLLGTHTQRCVAFPSPTASRITLFHAALK